jgi:hypothetical protein
MFGSDATPRFAMRGYPALSVCLWDSWEQTAALALTQVNTPLKQKARPSGGRAFSLDEQSRGRFTPRGEHIPHQPANSRALPGDVLHGPHHSLFETNLGQDQFIRLAEGIAQSPRTPALSP